MENETPIGTPTVSVIITYHNEGELLLRAVASVREQTYGGPVEIVVVDDASTVRPPDLPDGRFPARVVRSERSLYAGGARNLGLAETTGPYVCYLDADDVFLPGKLETQVAYLDAHPEVLVVGGSYYVH